MAISGKTGATLPRRGRPLALLLACSVLVQPLHAGAQSVFPPQETAGATGTPIIGRSAWPGAVPPADAPPDATDPLGANTADPGTDTPLAGDARLRMGEASASAAGEASYAEDLNQPYEEDDNLPAGPIEGDQTPRAEVDATGIRLGTFLLRPSVNQSVNTERRSGGTDEKRNYLATTVRGTLTSDWARHALTVNGEGTFERTISGDRDNEPEARIDADLRLDLAGDTVAHITGGYGFEREDNDDPNAIGGAATQSGVHQFDGGLSVERDLGVIRGLAAVAVSREIYTEAKLRDGTTVDLSDRDRTGIDGRLRLGYELSPALIPFVEVATGRTFYDERRDSAGYARSSHSYAARGGVEFDFGEKLHGEIGAGYETTRYDDDRLASLDAVTFDGLVAWSPKRGTDVNIGLATTMQDATAPGQSGWVEYALTAEVTHQLRSNLVARLSGGTTLRDFSGETSSETGWITGAGLTWNISRYLDLTGDVEYERNENSGRASDNIFRAGVGLTLRR